MANLHRYSVQEAVNSTVGGSWTVSTAGTAGSSASLDNTSHKLLSKNTSTLGVYSAVEIYYNFTTSETNVDSSNDLLIPANTQFFITVPRGLGSTVYFNFNSTSTTTGAVRMVEI